MSTLLAWTIMNRGKGRTYCRPSEDRSRVLSGSYVLWLLFKLSVSGRRSSDSSRERLGPELSPQHRCQHRRD
jgi:hypothetical protein